MRIDDLELFVAVAEHGSQQRAAESRGLTQSALSKAMARLAWPCSSARPRGWP